MFDTRAATEGAVYALHSSASSGRQWRALAQHFTGTRPVLTPPVPGYSGVPLGDVPGLARRARPIIDEIARGGAPVHLVGHSMGGAVAIKIAMMRPDLVTSLSVYEPVLPPVLAECPSLEEHTARRELDAVAARLMASVACGDAFSGMRGFVDFWNGDGTWSALGPERQDAMADMAISVMTDFGDMATEQISRRAIAAIKVPVLVMSGTCSPAVARLVVQRLIESLPNSTHTRLLGANHMAPVIEAERVNPVIARFIAHVEGAALESAWTKTPAA